MATFNFDDELVQGELGEREVDAILDAARLPYESHPAEQRSGIDFASGEVRVDVKTQSHKYIYTGNIPIEVFSVLEAQEPGWFFKSASDVIVWLYLDAEGDGLWHRGYMMYMGDELHEFITDNREEWRRVEVANDGRYGQYTAVNYLVPVPAFPVHLLAPFDPSTEILETALHGS
jgi:hypothetical protein